MYKYTQCFTYAHYSYLIVSPQLLFASHIWFLHHDPHVNVALEDINQLRGGGGGGGEREGGGEGESERERERERER